MLENLKMLLNITDTDRDELLNWLLTVTSKRLIILLGLRPKTVDGETVDPTVPEALEYIVVDVACARFNRIASEGMRSDSVEGESISFYDNDFDPYKKEIAEWLAAQEDDVTGGKGKVIFL